MSFLFPIREAVKYYFNRKAQTPWSNRINGNDQRDCDAAYMLRVTNIVFMSQTGVLQQSLNQFALRFHPF